MSRPSVILHATIGATIGWLAACAPARPRPSEQDHAIVPLAVGRDRAIVGRPLVLPIAAPGRAVLEARLSDGRTVAARAYRLVATPKPADADGAWLGDVATWSTEPATTSAVSEGPWIASLDLPADAAGLDLILAGERRALDWCQPATANDDAAWPPAMPAAMPREALSLPRFAAEAESPLTRWRFRLLADGLRPGSGFGRPFADPVLEQLARHEEDLWRVALARLFEADAELAARVRRRLAAVVEFSPGVWAPAWAGDPAALSRLRDDLLHPALPPDRRAAQAEQWLAQAAPMAAWVVEDGAAPIVPTIAVVSLLDRTSLAWVSWAGESEPSPDLVPVAPMTARLFAPALPIDNAGGARGAVAHVGTAALTLPVLTRPVPARPPGLVLGPFLPDATMAASLLGAPNPVPPAWTTAALLSRRTGDDDAWSIYVECLAVPGVGDASRERLDIHLGAAHGSVVRVWRDGRVEHLADGAVMGEGKPAEVVRSADRWAIRMTIPSAAADVHGVLRLAVVRTDARGCRSAVPRAMMPWQDRPGRLAVDTTAWDGR